MLRSHPAFVPDHDRFYYEPRAFWSVAATQASAAGPRRTVQFSQEHFKNGSRFPIRLTRLCLSPVGYLMRSFTAPTLTDYDACAAAISRASVSIEYPMGYSGQRSPGPSLLYGTDPTGGPSTLGTTSSPYASSLFGMSRWDFDVPYFVPQNYQVALELSNIRTYTGLTDITSFATHRMFYERTGSWILQHAPQRAGTILTAAAGGAFPGGPQPFVPPDETPFAGNGGPGTFMAGGGRWPGSEWSKQKANRGLPYTEVTGFGVFIDQRAFDDLVFATFEPTYPDLQVAPIAQRIATQCNTVAAGTGEKWWRDGAPLSLVTPSMTEAFVRELETPVVLYPGDSIIVSVQLPAPIVVDDTTVDPTFSIGVSLTGYAVVEDNNRKIPPMPGEFLPQPMTDT